MRYIYYGGSSKDRDYQYYLYDIQTKRDIALNLSDDNLKGAYINSIQFSPDGSKIAWITNSSQKTPPQNRDQVPRSIKETIVNYPLDFISTQDYRFTNLNWSLNHTLYFLLRWPFQITLIINIRLRQMSY